LETDLFFGTLNAWLSKPPVHRELRAYKIKTEMKRSIDLTMNANPNWIERIDNDILREMLRIEPKGMKSSSEVIGLFMRAKKNVKCL